MVDIALYVRIFEPDPSDEFVEKRTQVINELAEIFAKRTTVSPILSLASSLAESIAVGGSLPSALANDIAEVIRKYSPAFIREGHELQLIVCAAMAATQTIEAAKPSVGRWSSRDVFALGLWSSLTVQDPREEPKLEALRRDLLGKAKDLVATSALSARQRATVPDFSPTLTEGETGAELAKKLKAGIDKTVDALRTNAAIDREELDFLWWFLGDWSSLLECNLSPAESPGRAMAFAIEAATRLRRLPGDAHKNVLLRHISAGKVLTLTDLLSSLGSDRLKLASAFEGNAILAAAPAVFPLLTAIGSGKIAIPDGNVAKDLRDWAARAFLEAGILQIASLPATLI